MPTLASQVLKDIGLLKTVRIEAPELVKKISQADLDAFLAAYSDDDWFPYMLHADIVHGGVELGLAYDMPPEYVDQFQRLLHQFADVAGVVE